MIRVGSRAQLIALSPSMSSFSTSCSGETKRLYVVTYVDWMADPSASIDSTTIGKYFSNARTRDQQFETVV